MIIFIYTAMALIATFFGATTGMGGGVIMKPLMDIMGHYDSATIGVLSSVAVLAMAIVSTIRSFGKKNNVKLWSAIFLCIGSLGGGLLGQYMFNLTVAAAHNDALVKVIQNSILLALIVLIFVYMCYNSKGKVKNLQLKNPMIYAVLGVFLGVVSSFLGIGGGPINMAMFMMLFNLDIKTSTTYSVYTILMAQIAKLTAVGISSGFGGFDLKVLPYMVVAAVVAALFGSWVNKKAPDKVIYVMFNGMQCGIVMLCVTNIVRYALLI